MFQCHARILPWDSLSTSTVTYFAARRRQKCTSTWHCFVYRVVNLRVKLTLYSVNIYKNYVALDENYLSSHNMMKQQRWRLWYQMSLIWPLLHGWFLEAQYLPTTAPWPEAWVMANQFKALNEAFPKNHNENLAPKLQNFPLQKKKKRQTISICLKPIAKH